MVLFVHKCAGVVALLTIAMFWSATVIAGVALEVDAAIAVKTAIPYGLLVLVPALAAMGGSGYRLARGRSAGPVGAKRRRMPFIAANGLLVLVPSALFLAARAQAAIFDPLFYTVQAIELVAGAVNLTLLALNMRDGLRMTAARRLRQG